MSRLLFLLVLLTGSLFAQTPTPASGPAPTNNSNNEPSGAFQSAYIKSQDAFMKGNFTVALKFIDDALKTGEKPGPTYNLKGAILSKQGQFEQAKVAFEKAAQLMPGNWQARFNLVELLYLQKRYADARAGYIALQSEFPKQSEIPFRIFMTYLMEDNTTEVNRTLDKMDPYADSPLFYICKACVAFHQKDEKEGTNWLQSATKIYSTTQLFFYIDCLIDEGWVKRDQTS
jgi:tetratricopeptide (TPR) repeat protein